MTQQYQSTGNRSLKIESEYITKKELAEKLKVSISFIDKSLLRGLPRYKLSQRTIRFKESEVVAYLERKKRP